jgi:hypothetical protein
MYQGAFVIPRCIRYYEQSIRLETFYDLYVGRRSGASELYSVGPDWLECCFVNKDFATGREF